MPTYSNAYLEHYADRFVLLRLSRHGMTLLQYLEHPQTCEAKGRFEDLRMAKHGISFAQYLANPEACETKALEAEPPTPGQHAAILRLWADQDTGLRRRPVPGVEPHWSDDMLQDPRELLARWRQESDAAERELEHLPQRNGAIVEPLHHHRHPRTPACDFTRRKAQ